ncbi:MAG: SpoIIE family protein phosphatase [Clostridia bacterium]|nr:SpoIIE family protein phosphatase [Clostridia bacterium]
MTKEKKKLRAGVAVNIIGAIVILFAVFGVVVGFIGYVSFTTAFKEEYSVSTYHMADTATTLINGDHLEAYLAGDEAEEYQRTQNYLDIYCKKISVSLIYLIQVDRSDYGRFVSIFNSVDNSVDDSSYTPWELGHKRDTTNDEYRQKYESLYSGESAYETVYRTKVSDGVHPHVTTMVPVKNSSDEVVGILCVQRPIREIHDAQRPYLRRVAISTILLAVVASVFAALFIRRQFVKPIRKVANETARFAKENTKGEPLSGISRYRELAALAESIDTMETDMVSYIDNLTDITAEKERIGAELSLANEIQMNSIPNDFPAFPERKDFDIFASMDPAKEVGGDFYNFFMIDDDRIALVIGDVSGKGVPAALFMMVTNILITDRTLMGGTPAEILNFVNANICAHNKAEMFVTVWLGILELSTGKLTAANAGHEYPVIKRAGGSFEILRDKHGFVVGGLAESTYKDYELTLAPGDKIFVYTDGVPEATDANEGLFGQERMLAALNGVADGTPEEILKTVRREVDSFVKDAEQFDDLTMLCIEYKGQGEERS